MNWQEKGAAFVCVKCIYDHIFLLVLPLCLAKAKHSLSLLAIIFPPAKASLELFAMLSKILSTYCGNIQKYIKDSD